MIFEVAIEEGATHIRVGYGAFRQTPQAVTVGFYSPLPPARTGVADYSAGTTDGSSSAASMCA